MSATSLHVLSTSSLDQNELKRYARHISLKEVGVDGQIRLKQSRVAVVGLGGLGAPVAQYLAAAGVGTLGLFEPDKVDVTNLQRQVLYTTFDVGQPKADAAAAHIKALNPHVQLSIQAVRLDRSNALGLLADYDVVVDATDNFPARYLLNDACVLLQKPLVYASVHRFEGQVSVFDARSGPCYRCLSPKPPPAHLSPNCSEVGVLGALTGIVGSIQAAEALKLLLQVGEPLIGRVLLLDGLDMNAVTIELKKNDACPVCGPTPSITQLIDYEAFCGDSMQSEPKSIDVHELRKKQDRKDDFVLLDVREADEYEFVRLEPSLHIPTSEFQQRVGELENVKGKEIVVLCHHGSRSNLVANFLRTKGFRAKNLTGGINAWSEEIDPKVAQY